MGKYKVLGWVQYIHKIMSGRSGLLTRLYPPLTPADLSPLAGGSVSLGLALEVCGSVSPIGTLSY